MLREFFWASALSGFDTRDAQALVRWRGPNRVYTGPPPEDGCPTVRPGSHTNEWTTSTATNPTSADRHGEGASASVNTSTVTASERASLAASTRRSVSMRPRREW